ncbi:MAG TPA: hypothetical protein VHO25_03055 [Polyangiaceae bacterium]|nr:hypothetical protein [Polyangiaceae bacterium]
MARHANAVLLACTAVLLAFIVAIVNSWYMAAAAIVLFALFGGGAWVILVARVEGGPSYEDQERRPHRSRTPKQPSLPRI